MADVTAALVTFNEIAICGSDGSKMLVASVPMAARTERTAIARPLETGTSLGTLLVVWHWPAMGAFALIDRQVTRRRVTRFAPLAEPFLVGSAVLPADDALDRDGGGFTATDAKGCNAAFEVLRL